MKNQKTSSKNIRRIFTSRNRVLFVSVGLFIVASGVIAGSLFMSAGPASAQSIDEYCSGKYTGKFAEYGDDTAKNACKAGITGKEDCADYTGLFDQSIGDICTTEAKNHPSGLTTTTPSPSPTISPTTSPEGTGSNPNFDAAQLQNTLDQTNSLSDYLDILHKAGPDSDKDTSKEADNNYDSYVNGAGKQQKIIPIKQGSGDSPAILFFNGGGWHANDQTGERVAAGEDGAEKAGDHGYAMFDVTYRLGSSGVYYMFEDVMRGIKHMRENASLYGIDPNKIVIWGDSAGGSLTMRAAASGKSGAKAAVGWSAITNAYTGMFRSIASFAIGMDHSTCVPTDLAGFANFADLVNGGSGDVAEYGQGLSSNDFSSLGIGLPGGSASPGGFAPENINIFSLFTEGLVAGRNALSAANDVESISSQIKSGGIGSFSGSAFNIATTKFSECLDNFNALSPALYTSPDTPPSFLGEFENDMTVGPDQATGMRDKLRELGIESEALILPGSDDCIQKAPDTFGTGCHLGYYKDFVCPTLKFIDHIVQPDRGTTDCGTGVADNAGSADNSGGSNSSEGSSGTSNGNSNNSNPNNGGGPGGQQAGQSDEQKCKSGGGSWADRDGDGKSSCSYPSQTVCDTWDSSCNGGSHYSSGSTTTPIDLNPEEAGSFGGSATQTCSNSGTYRDSTGKERIIQTCVGKAANGHTWTFAKYL